MAESPIESSAVAKMFEGMPGRNGPDISTIAENRKS